jgi:hypothetical protein
LVLGKPALATPRSKLVGKNSVQWRLAILRKTLEDSVELIGAFEHLALRLFFMVEIFLQLLRHR